MKKIVLAILLIGSSINLSCFSQSTRRQDIQGTYTYTAEMGKWALQINKSTFTIIEYDKERSMVCTFFSDTIALGKVKYKERNLIQLQSDDFIKKVHKTMNIKKSYDKNINDSISIQFILGSEQNSDHNPLRIRIYSSGPILFLDHRSTEITTTRNTIGYYFIFRVTQNSFCNSFDFKYNNLSPMYITGPYIDIRDHNVVQIHMPDFLSDFFTRFYIDNEYCKVSPNSIIWRDKVFRKISNEILSKAELEEYCKKTH